MLLRTLALFGAVVSLILNLYWMLLYLANKELMHKEPKAFSNKFVSIIIPAYNEEASIRSCVESLLNLDYPEDMFEVIVVDDASTDGTYDAISDFEGLANVKILRRKKNSGMKSSALNTARPCLDKRTELVVILDADSVVQKNTLKHVLPYFEDEAMGATSLRYLPWNRKHILARLQFFEYLYSMFWRRILSLLDSMYVTPGVFSVYRKSVIDEVGWFSEKTLGEDMELALRIQKTGYRIGYAYSTTAYTIVPESIKGFVKQRIRWQRNFISSFTLHPDLILNRKYGTFSMIMVPLNFVSIGLILYVCSLFSISLLKKSLALLSWFYKLYLVNFDFLTLIKTSDFGFSAISSEVIRMRVYSFLVGIDTLNFLLLMSIILALILLAVIRKNTKISVGLNILLFPVFLVVYLPLNSALWLYSIAISLLGVREKW